MYLRDRKLPSGPCFSSGVCFKLAWRGRQVSPPYFRTSVSCHHRQFFFLRNVFLPYLPDCEGWYPPFYFSSIAFHLDSSSEGQHEKKKPLFGSLFSTWYETNNNFFFLGCLTLQQHGFISETDLSGQLCVLPVLDRRCRSSLLSQ